MLFSFSIILAKSTLSKYDVQKRLQQENGFYSDIPRLDINPQINNRIVDYPKIEIIRIKVREQKDTLQIHIGNKFATLQEMQIAIIESRDSHYRDDVIFYIDKFTKWKNLQSLMEEVALTNRQRVLIAIKDQRTTTTRFYKHYILHTKELNSKWFNSPSIPPPPWPSFFDDYIGDKK